MPNLIFNNETFRQFFPFFNIYPHIAYLDNAATSLKPALLIDSLTDFYQSAGSVHRSQYDEKNTLRFEKARKEVKKWVNAETNDCVIWTSGTTHGINLVAQGLSLNKNDEIIISMAEHHANFVPWQQIAQRKGAKIHILPFNTQSLIDETQLKNTLTPWTKIVALNWVSNITGAEQPILSLIKIIRQHSHAKILIDAAQAVSLFPCDIQQLDCDFLVFSAHKMYGPTGLGVLTGKKESLKQLSPLLYGGKMVEHVSPQQTTFAPLPYRFEAGTPNIANVIAFGEVLTWLKTQPMQQGYQQARQLCQQAATRLKTYNATIYTAPNSLIVSFKINGLSSADLSLVLTQENVAFRSGKHCAHPYLQQLGEDNLLRLSFAPYNNEQDLDIFFHALDNALDLLC